MTTISLPSFASGVPGLDGLLGGGFVAGSLNLIAGPPGCGKTTLAHQIMFAQAGAARQALYLTGMADPARAMLRYQQQFGFYDGATLADGVRYADLASAAADASDAQLLAHIDAEVRQAAPALVFLDSFGPLIMSTGDAREPGSAPFVERLALLAASWNATVFLVSEHAHADTAPAFTAADSILMLSQRVDRNTVLRKIQAVKTRGHAQTPGLHGFRIGADGLVVFPRAIHVQARSMDAAGPARGPLARLSMGNATLDEMLNGGLPQAYALLVVGPSGSGKSILATEFLAEGARCGEHGVLAAFERGAGQIASDKLGQLIAQGKVALIGTSSLGLSIDELLHDLVAMVGATGAKRLVIDSLSGLALALAPEFLDDFRGALYRMVSVLQAMGTTVLMTCELEDRYTDLRFSPFGSASLADAIIVQRYVEIAGDIERVLAVAKLRASAHSRTLRLYEINDSGLLIRDSLTKYEGILSGHPSDGGRYAHD